MHNSVTLVGRLGSDPELRSIKDDTKVCQFSLATDNGKDADPDWHQVQVFGGAAEPSSKYLKKGSKVLVVGRLKNNNYEKNGVKHYGYRVNCYQCTFLDSRGESEARDDGAPF